MRRGRDSQVLQHLGSVVADNGLARRIGNTIGPLWWGIDPDGRPNAKKLSEIVETMVRIARPEKIILFGSGARGRMNAHSDLDFLLIKNDTQPRATARRIRRQAPRGRPPLDILIASREDVERNRHNPSFVIHDALKEGRVLYDDRAECR